MNHRNVWISTVILTIISWIIYHSIGTIKGTFVVYCTTVIGAGHCPSQFEIFLDKSLVVLPIMLIISAGISYFIGYLISRYKS
jgi:hypothetical protein